jgi:leukotriene-A4 hydrolase
MPGGTIEPREQDEETVSPERVVVMAGVSQLVVGLVVVLWFGLAVASPGLTAGAASASDGNPPARGDVHSMGNPGQVRVTHLDLDLTVHFDRKELAGVAILDVERQPGVAADVPLQLDTRGLTIGTVGIRSTKSDPLKPFTPTPFQLGPTDPILGSRLTIPLDPETKQVRIEYRTAPSASALQWLEPSLTAGKARPFLFTQSEAIHARSWIPLQDSPGARITYAAIVRVPKGLTAVMAADSQVKPEDAREGVFRFAMPQPIPTYLIAMAVGDLAFRPLGPRTGVWAEPSVLDAAAFEFADVEAMVKAVEKRFGPYQWGRYDILVLPPSFPFGGMENPKLTFATPTILAGDRSLVSLIAHELAHSWSGNLVTNATWRDFWLNEGFTTYLERRIIEDLYGADRAEMESVLGLAELHEELKGFSPKDQVLHIDLTGRDPDDGMTRIPYEKGALFLRTLEKTFGRDRFDNFLRSYFDRFAFRSITTDDFTAYLKDHLLLDPKESNSIDRSAWLEGPGLPTGFAEPKSARLEAIDRTAKGWLDGTNPTDKIDAGDWSTHEWIRLLQAMPEKVPTEKLAELDKRFGLTNRGNSEIAHQWLLIAIRNDYAPAMDRLKTYLTTIGRRKLVLPLYKALLATPAGRLHAEAIYATARPGYHPITVESVDRLLKGGK